MLKLGSDEIAKYPFMQDAGAYLKETTGFTLEQFGSDPDLKYIQEIAVKRIGAAAAGDIFKSGLYDMDSKEQTTLNEVASFLVAVVLLRMAKASALFNRFALAEARRAERYLERDMKEYRKKIQTSSKKVEEMRPARIIEELFGMRIRRDGDDFVIPVPDYVRHSVHFYEREWKLINRHVVGGDVFLTAHGVVRLIRNDLVTYIREKITKGKYPDSLTGFEDAIGSVRGIAGRFEAKVEYTGKFPPCVDHAIRVLQRGDNLPHSGRFMLATFLLGIERKPEEIIPLFKNAPDYNERITTYQVNNLAGTGGGTRYTCPSCEKLKTQDLCFATPECNGIVNPLQFGRRK